MSNRNNSKTVYIVMLILILVMFFVTGYQINAFGNNVFFSLVEVEKSLDEEIIVINGKNYVNHSDIVISGDDDLLNQANDEGWVGTGTESDPIVIEGYYFKYKTHAVSIQDVNLFIEFKDNYITGNPDRSSQCAIVFIRCSNVKILNNYVSFAHDSFYLSHLTGIRVENNFANMSSEYGIHLNFVEDSLIKNNTFTNGDDIGTRLYSSSNNIIINNEISNNNGSGILLLKLSNNNTIKDNEISNNDGYAVLIGDNTCEKNTISNNNFSDNTNNKIEDLGIDNVVQGAKGSPAFEITLSLLSICFIYTAKKKKNL